MTTFYLQYGIAHAPQYKGDECGWHEERTFLDDRVHFKTNEVIAEIEADNWIEARYMAIGY